VIARACWFLDRLPRETWTIDLELRPRPEVAGGPNMNVKAEFLFDFGSPNAYLAHRVLPGIESRTGVRFVYVPALLGGIFKATGNVSPAVSLQGIQNKGAYQGLEMRRFIARHGIDDFRHNPDFPVNTLKIMRGAIVAQREGFFERYVDEIFRHMWSAPKKLDDPAVFRAALEESGIDAGVVLDGIQEPSIKARLLSNTEEAVARGVFGSPSFFVGDEHFFGKDRLEEVEREIVAALER
jgi:2-hydroxychromene-2-carboxylate isomerase